MALNVLLVQESFWKQTKITHTQVPYFNSGRNDGCEFPLTPPEKHKSPHLCYLTKLVFSIVSLCEKGLAAFCMSGWCQWPDRWLRPRSSQPPPPPVCLPQFPRGSFKFHSVITVCYLWDFQPKSAVWLCQTKLSDQCNALHDPCSSCTYQNYCIHMK